MRVLTLNIVSSCNSRCVSCRYGDEGPGVPPEKRMTTETVVARIAEARGLGAREILFSGGEPLLHPDIAVILAGAKAARLRRHIHTNGLALHRVGPADFEEMHVSLDAVDAKTYAEIRGVDGYEQVIRAIRRLREAAPQAVIRARTMIHRMNYRDALSIAETAKANGFSSISFLAADVYSAAFGRDGPSVPDEAASLRLTREDVEEFSEKITAWTARLSELETEKFLDGSGKLSEIARYYRALSGDGDFEPQPCTAPRESVVIETKSAMRSCFFLPSVDVSGGGIPAFLRVRDSIARVDPMKNEICRRCVCRLPPVSLRSKIMNALRHAVSRREWSAP